MLPAYYGDQSDFFGIAHPSEKPGKSHSLIICQPLLGEANWTHWALKQVAQRAARDGYDVFRFDFSGTGNSLVDTTSLSLATWTGDIERAMDVADERWKNDRTSVLGVRLGFALAALTSFHRDIENLVGWDPVLTGRTWLAERMADCERHNDGTTDFQGYTLRAEFISELEALDVRSIDSVHSSAITTVGHHWDHAPEQMGIDVVKSQDDWNWGTPVPALFFAHDSINQICEHLS